MKFVMLLSTLGGKQSFFFQVVMFGLWVLSGPNAFEAVTASLCSTRVE